MNDKNFNSDNNDARREIVDCQDVIAHLGDYTDHELPSSTHAAMDQHLDSCPECAAFLASYNHVIESAAELREPEEPLSLEVQNRLRSALNKRLGINLPLIA